VFSRLNGNRNINENNLVYMELLELSNDLPLGIDMIACTLSDIGENVKTITRELFKSKLLSLTV
jgi:hypothetical protein